MGLDLQSLEERNARFEIDHGAMLRSAAAIANDSAAPFRRCGGTLKVITSQLQLPIRSCILNNSLFRAVSVTGPRGTVEALPLDRTLEILRAYGALGWDSKLPPPVARDPDSIR